jgi:hypothetical protein
LRDDPTTSSSVRELLQPGLASKRLPTDVRQRSERRLNRLMVVPAAAGVLFWIKGVAIAGLCVVTTVAAVHQMTKAKTAPVAAQRGNAPEARPTKLPAVASPSPGLAASAPPADIGAPSAPSASPPPPLTPTLAAALAPTPRASQTLARPPTTANMPAGAATLAEALVPVEPEAPQPLDPLAREAAMLEQSRAMLDSNPGGALEELDRYTERFPAGRLTIESGLLAVEALKRLGRIEEARARGAALLEQARGSLYEARIRTLMSE